MKRLFLLVIVLYYTFIIFSFSAQPAVRSSSQSKNAVGIIYDAVVVKVSRPPVIHKNDFIKIAEPIIRKLAHFGNFLILAFFMSMYTACYKRRGLFSAGLTLAVCLLAAASDEIHQLFVSGRACRGMDIVIDVSGAALGILIYNMPGAFSYLSYRRNYREK